MKFLNTFSTILIAFQITPSFSAPVVDTALVKRRTQTSAQGDCTSQSINGHTTTTGDCDQSNSVQSYTDGGATTAKAGEDGLTGIDGVENIATSLLGSVNGQGNGQGNNGVGNGIGDGIGNGVGSGGTTAGGSGPAKALKLAATPSGDNGGTKISNNGGTASNNLLGSVNGEGNGQGNNGVGNGIGDGIGNGGTASNNRGTGGDQYSGTTAANNGTTTTGSN